MNGEVCFFPEKQGRKKITNSKICIKERMNKKRTGNTQ